MNLYVTDWAPNGTNDLLVCDENHSIVAVVEQATFGIDVARFVAKTCLVADADQVFSVKTKQAAEFLECSEFTRVKAITLETLRKRLCVSPVDPQGKQLLSRLAAVGIKL